MNINELNEAVKQAMCEEISQDRLKELAKEQIKEWQDELLENAGSDLDLISDLADAYGYKLYDRALTINVKYMPDIEEPLASNIIEKYGEDTVGQIIEDTIEVFSTDLQSTFGKDFVILGRMGGYWGLDNAPSQIQITEKGLDELASILIKESKNPDRDYNEVIEQAIKDDDEREVINVFYTLLQYDLSDFADDLANIKDGIDFKPSFIEKMDDLKTRIKEEEKEMNTEEFWSRYDG